MRYFVMESGDRFEAATVRDLVRQLRAKSFLPERNQELWMAAFRQRVYRDTKRRLDVSSEAAFVQSLLDTNLMKEVSQ